MNNSKSKSPKRCQYCNDQATFLCGSCEVTAYCSRQHQIQDWKRHKHTCKIAAKGEQITAQKNVAKQRYKLRKEYFENLAGKMYDDCLKVAQKLVLVQSQNLKATRDINNEFQYGSSITLLCRTLIILSNHRTAKIQITKYLKERRHFLEDLRDIHPWNRQQPVKQNNKQFLEKKVALVAAVANILYSLQMPVMDLYITYTKHIEKFFGQGSIEVSNCMYMIGCYYKEIGHYNKAIACFLRASQRRTSKSGDCMQNLGLIMNIKNKIPQAIDFLQQSIALKKQQYGENSKQITETHQILAYIYSQQKQYSLALRELQKVIEIFSNDMRPEVINSVQKTIRDVYDNIKEYKLIKRAAEEAIHQQQQKLQGDFINSEAFKVIENDYKNVLKISSDFLSKLRARQLLNLSALQLQLQNCKSEFQAAMIVGKSQFLHKIPLERLRQLKADNEKLFENINLEEIVNWEHQQKKQKQ